MRAAGWAALLLGVVAGSPAAWAAQVEVIQAAGPSEQRIDLVVLGDGYTADEQAKLTDDARTAIEGMFQEPPYSNYRQLFNVKLLHVISNESGADNGAAGDPTRDTALGAHYFCNDIERLLCVDQDAVFAAAVADAPEYDVLVVIVNDSKYGGAGGSVAVLSTHSQAVDLLLHELSHTIGGLADEYQTEYPGFPACPNSTDCPEPNATIRNTRETAKWTHWLEASTPVPTPEGSSQYNDVIGVFEGGRYKSSGVFRPKDDTCMMQYLAQPFCSVCREGLVWSFWRNADVISGLTPDNSQLVQICEGGALTVHTPPVDAGGFSFLWTVDGEPLAETSNTLTINGVIANGTHTVRVTARDATAMVRSDPQGLLSQQAEWTISACTAGECDQVAACDGSTCQTTPKPAGTACGAQACVDGVQTGAGACDGSGQCVSGDPVPCAAYTCDDAGELCRTTCSDDSHCASDNVCVDGACVAPQPESASCGGCSTAGAGSWAALVLVAWATRRKRK